VAIAGLSFPRERNGVVVSLRFDSVEGVFAVAWEIPCLGSERRSDGTRSMLDHEGHKGDTKVTKNDGTVGIHEWTRMDTNGESGRVPLIGQALAVSGTPSGG
jgi:hypothetical protein